MHAIRTGAAFLESLRDSRQIWIDGERISDVTRDPRFAAARTVAELNDMQHDTALHATMTYKSPTSGAPVGLFVAWTFSRAT
jgi:4-hydroxyphenylacetate 3-monooxygenase